MNFAINTEGQVMKFSAEIKIIGVNPFVFVPERILKDIFNEAKKNKGHIPVKGTINGKPFKQTLVKYSGEWQLYANTNMLKNSPKRIDEIIELTIVFDTDSREISPPEEFIEALNADNGAKIVFENLPASHISMLVFGILKLKKIESLFKSFNIPVWDLYYRGSYNLNAPAVRLFIF